MTFCAEVRRGKQKRRALGGKKQKNVTAWSASGNASDRGGGGAQPAVTLPPVVELPSQVGRGGKGSGRSQSHHALPGRPLLLPKHANIHSSEMLKVVTGGRTHDNRPLHPRSPHEDAFIQAFPPSGKSLLKRKTIRKHTQPENGKQALSYVQEKPASRGRQKQQLCHGRLVFFCHVGNAVFVCWASSSQKVSGGLLCPTTLLRKEVIKQKIKTSKKNQKRFQFSLWLRPPKLLQNKEPQNITMSYINFSGMEVVKKQKQKKQIWWNEKLQSEGEEILSQQVR